MASADSRIKNVHFFNIKPICLGYRYTNRAQKKSPLYGLNSDNTRKCRAYITSLFALNAKTIQTITSPQIME
jgi:hypothetical protein